MKFYKALLSASAFSILTACGGGSSDSSSTPTDPVSTTETGVFLDSPVINIGYRTETIEGVTNSLGEYNYLAGETVTFFIGDLVFPATAATGTVTPLNLADSVDISDPKVINMIRLLQTLDADGNPDNGLTITDTAKSAATQVNFSLSESGFENATTVKELIANAGQDTIPTELVSTSVAVAHFGEVLIANKIIEESELKLVDFEALTSVDGTAIFEFMLYEGGGGTPVTVSLDSNGTGNMDFINYDEVNRITDWSISSSGVLNIEEVADDDSVGNWTITPVDSLTGFSVRVEQTPVGLDFVAELEVALSPLIAVWEHPSESTMFMYLPDGRYFAIQWVEVNNFVGFERGTYTESSAGITFSTLQNNDGQALTCEKDKDSTCSNIIWGSSVSGDDLTLTVPGDGSFTFDKISFSNDSLQGVWELPNENVIFMFLPDGRYFAVQWVEDKGYTGFERGTYVESAAEITFTTLQNNDGQALTCEEDEGITCSNVIWGSSVSGDDLTLTVPVDGAFSFHRLF